MSTDSTVCSDEQIQWLILAWLSSRSPGHTYCLNQPVSTDEDAGHTLLRILLQLFDPFRYVLICVSASEVKDQESTWCSLIIRMSDCPVPFLTSGIPDLYFNLLAIQIDSFGSKFHSNSSLWIRYELILLKPRKQVRFAHPRICINIGLTTYDYHFEEEIKSFTDNRHLFNYNNTLFIPTVQLSNNKKCIIMAWNEMSLYNVYGIHREICLALVFGGLSLLSSILALVFGVFFGSITGSCNLCIRLWLICCVCGQVSSPADLSPSFSTTKGSLSSAAGFSLLSQAIWFPLAIQTYSSIRVHAIWLCSLS